MVNFPLPFQGGGWSRAERLESRRDMKTPRIVFKRGNESLLSAFNMEFTFVSNIVPIFDAWPSKVQRQPKISDGQVRQSTNKNVLNPSKFEVIFQSGIHLEVAEDVFKVSNAAF